MDCLDYLSLPRSIHEGGWKEVSRVAKEVSRVANIYEGGIHLNKQIFRHAKQQTEFHKVTLV